MIAPLGRNSLGWLLMTGVVACQGPTPAMPVQVVERDELEPILSDPVFSDVRDMALSPDGLWVLDRQAPFVNWIPAGPPGDIRRFGDRGRGPNELISPVSLRPVAGGVIVRDVGLNKRVKYALTGEMLEVRESVEASGWIRPDMAEVSHLDPWRVRGTDSAVFRAELPGRVTSAQDFARGTLVRSDPGLQASAPLVRYADLTPRDQSALGQFASMPLWDACGDAIVLWDPRGDRVLWLNASGEIQQQVSIPAADGVITLVGIEGFLRRMARHELGPGAPLAEIDFHARARELRAAFGDRATPFVDLRCGTDGSSWLQRFDLEADALGHGSTWVQVSENGRRLEVTFPSDFRPWLFEPGFAIGVLKTGGGDLLVRWRRPPEK